MEKIALIGVFDPNSTNVSQADAFEDLGFEVLRLDYRKLMRKGAGNAMRSLQTAHEIVGYSQCCYWYMDPIDDEVTGYIKHWTEVCHTAAYDKIRGLPAAKKINPRAFWACEGFDHRIDKPVDVEPTRDVGFIGHLSRARKRFFHAIERPVHAISGVSRIGHSAAVRDFKISLNKCTAKCASDRVYKVLASEGFLITDDWIGREATGLVDGEHLVIANTPEEFREKIDYYLANDRERRRIARAGLEAVQPFNRTAWARTILENNT
jgi:spore maturation protein CgeB